jgi:hypothetical protein
MESMAAAQRKRMIIRTGAFAGLGVVLAAAGGCGMSQLTSTIDGGVLGSGQKKPENATWTPIITEESMLTAARTNNDGPIEMAAANGCPVLQVEGGQRYVTFYEGNRVGDANSVVHRGEITKTARECQGVEGQVVVKYGVAGRVLLGPKGKPGTITLPVTMQVLDKAKGKVRAEPFAVTVTITKENPLAYFSLVRDVTIPVKQGTQPADYSITLAFDKGKGGAV